MAIYTTVREKLESIQKSKKESDIFPTLQMLFQTKGFSNVEITHGNSEMGKDLVFKHYDSMLGRETWFALVVKNKNAGQEVFEEGGEITRQIKLAFEVPYKDAKAEEHYINTVIVIINGSVSAQAKTILSSVMPVHFRTNIEIWNYQKLCEEIDTHIRDFFLSNDGVSQDDIIVLNYKNALIKRLSSLDNAKQLFSGLNISEINDIFINVKTTISRYEAEKEKYQDTTIRHQEEPDDSITIINSNKNTIVTGIATSGKSLLLKRIGVNAVNIYKRIGVFWFRFRELSLNQFNIDQLIAEQFRSLANTEIKDEYFDRYILLFDGLDEVKSKKDRIVFIEKINQYLTHKLNTHSIISSRNIDIFDDNLFDGYEHIELLPFDIGQAFKLVKKIIPDNKSKASQFVEAIRDQQLSNTLTRTPMALTLMAILYKEDAIDLKELPANITELYNKFSDYYLDRWDATKGLSAQYKFEETKHILAFIGQYMHVRGMREIDIPQLSGFLQEIYDKFSYDELTDIQGFIEKLKNRNCLFIYNETSNTFCFNNLSFQEYFASIFYDDSNEQELVDNIYNEWWANVIVFYNGKSPKRSVFIEKILTSRVPTDTSTMYRHLQIVSKCVQAVHLISNDVEKRTIENLINTFDSFYKCTILPAIENPANAGLLRSLSTLDMILQARNIFCQIFQSKHINQEIFSSVGMDILLKSTFGYSDVTLYCLSYHLSDITNDGMFLQYFIGKKLNTRWDRIVYKDIDHMRLKAMLSPNIYNRIKRKQRQNKIYIDKQFKEPAILHLSDGLKV